MTARPPATNFLRWLDVLPELNRRFNLRFPCDSGDCCHRRDGGRDKTDDHIRHRHENNISLPARNAITDDRALTSEKKRGDLTTRWPPRAYSSSGMASPRKSQSEKFLLVGLKNYYDDNKNHNLPNSRLSLGENKGICGAIVNYAHLSQNIANTDLALTRIDYRLNARNQFSGHYMFQNYDLCRPSLRSHSCDLP